MRILLGVVLVVVGLLVLAFAIGLALPRNHRAGSRIVLAKSPAEVWPVIRDLGALLGSWTELKSARRLPDEGGKEVWEQNAGGWPLKLIVEEVREPTRLMTRVDGGADAAFGGTWTYELVAEGSGTRVTVTEDGWVKNPLFRTMMKVMGEHRTADGYLKALGKKLGESVSPVHVD